MLVAGQMDIAFNPVCAVGQGLQVSGPGMLGKRGTGTAVGVYAGPCRVEGFTRHAVTVAHGGGCTGASLG